MTRPLEIALLGLGTVGAGVAELLQRHAELLAERAGGPLQLRRVAVRDPDKPRDVDLDPDLLCGDPTLVAADPEIDVLVEVMGGIEPARTLLCEALRRGVHVVTANKELLAKHGAELREAALQGGAGLHCEAAVAGGIPIVKALAESLSGNRVQALYGIVNGTTNFILTLMTQDKVGFAEALKQAQDLGYAEANPAADVDGDDAASKLAILAGLAFGAEFASDDVYRAGIGHLTPTDIQAAADLGHVIKLLAIAKDRDGQVELRVHPTMIPADHPLAAVHGAYNAVFVHGDAVGDLMFYGRGAGRMPTASAVLADIVDAAQDLRRGVSGRIPMPSRRLAVLPMTEVTSRYYLAIQVADQPGVLGAIATVLGRHQVSVASMIQKGRRDAPVDLLFVTHQAVERQLLAALEEVAGLPQVERIAQVIRVEGSEEA
ncbi:MAG: homoserine dehydrogenase [Myxococcota bacterium]